MDWTSGEAETGDSLGACRTYRAAVTDLRASALCSTGVSPVDGRRTRARRPCYTGLKLTKPILGARLRRRIHDQHPNGNWQSMLKYHL